ncbi:hypothetical protein E0Z10_g8219 [Xylaria hypoxylon]|uniref:MYND-type domain-containing protein n=1 Tax=Xylaria hypoxylon TaxID=37992 RepID=A0A4Z0Y9M0_9PEZI|nr:hypothetical protein E0Z10_g8219 [Xylaria hypoxylon]
MYIDQEALDLVRSQAKKLYELSATMDTWQQSKYGSVLSHCDSTTLLIVRKVWGFYATDIPRDILKRHIESALERAKSKKGDPGKEINLTGFRSAVPAQLNLFQYMDTLHQNYWKYGRNDSNTDALAAANHPNPNPMFLVGEDKINIHYGTDPLLGFHLATAYTPIPQDDAEFSRLKELPPQEKILAVARTEFCQWMVSYREHLADTKIRFFIGDAIAFAYTLHHKRVTTSSTAHWYRDRYGLQPLTLDASDYASDTAPLEFDVIDTSNLCDHVGSLTLLTATSPLLRNHTTSVLFTEVLARNHKSYREVLDNILGGHVPTLTTLLGLFPVEYWTNTSSISLGDENILDLSIGMTLKDEAKNDQRGQMFLRTCWKRPLCMIPSTESCFESASIRFDANQLANVLYQVYVHMFRGEDYTLWFKFFSLGAFQNQSLVWYHRASFASFLRLVQTRVVCNWDAVMDSLLILIESRPNAPIGMNYIQELFIYLHIMGIYSTDVLKHWHIRKQDFTLSLFRITPLGEKWGDLRYWENIDPVVCLTLKIPRKKLEFFTKMDRMKLGMPVVHCTLEPAGSGINSWHSIFSACQLAFGDISTQGERCSNSFKVSVTEDDAGWSGSSPLIAVFYVPAFSLLLQPREAVVTFGIHSNPENMMDFSSKLGLSMKLHETTLGDSDTVYVTQHAPHQTGFPVAIGAAPTTLTNPTSVGANASLVAGVNQETGRIVTFTGRLDITCNDRKQALQNGCQVHKSIVSPSEIAIRLGQTAPLTLSFPVFVLEAQQTLRIARKSSWVEVIVQVADSSDWMKYPHYMYPIHLRDGKPINWNMPYLQLLKCPVVDTDQRNKLDWLTTHLSTAMSARERALREHKGLPRSAGEQLRLEFKETLYTIFIEFAGIQGRKSNVFCLADTAKYVGQIFILVSSFRINLADRAVVLDCAVLPLHAGQVPGLKDSPIEMSSTSQINMIPVNGTELQLWRRVLPAYVERCRTWAHRADCEYLKSGKIPLTMEHGKQLLCTCGNGEFPPDYKVNTPSWETLKKHAVRAAISPAFWAPFADQMYRPDLSRVDIARAAGRPSSGGCASCGRTKQEDGKDLLSCARCMKIKYCSRDCQRADWPLHKVVCK